MYASIRRQWNVAVCELERCRALAAVAVHVPRQYERAPILAQIGAGLWHSGVLGEQLGGQPARAVSLPRRPGRYAHNSGLVPQLQPPVGATRPSLASCWARGLFPYTHGSRIGFPCSLLIKTRWHTAAFNELSISSRRIVGL